MRYGLELFCALVACTVGCGGLGGSTLAGVAVPTAGKGFSSRFGSTGESEAFGLAGAPDSRAAMAGAAKCAASIDDGVIVFVSADGGWKYLSSGAWTDDVDVVTERARNKIYF